MTFATLRALHTVIGDALAEMERVYQQNGAKDSTLLDYPSLDIPYYSNTTHTAEEEAAEKLASDPAVVTAANRIVAACGQLSASVHRPFFSLVEGGQSEHLAACLQFLEASNTVEILRIAGPDGLHVNDIAQRIEEVAVGSLQDRNGIASPTDPNKLSHILRLLATYHYLREVRPNVFANNRLSAQLNSGKTLEQLRDAPEKKYEGTDGVGACLALLTDDFFKSVAYLTDNYLPHTARAVALRKLTEASTSTGRQTSAAKYKTPFNLAFRTALGYFDWLELPENKVRLTEFGRGMTGARLWEVAENVIGAFPWKELPRDSVVIDVGGGIGSTSVVLANAYPHLRFVVQDREQVVGIASSIWGEPHAELIRSGRVSFLTQSFFEPQPRSIDVPGVGSITAPSVFVLRGCTHNWPDENVQKMLGHLRDAAAPTTKLLIIDILLPLACYDDTADGGEPIPGAERTLVPEGSPLLANLGRAHVSEYLLDLTMMAVLNAKERTLREMSDLALSAGWKIERLTRAPGSLWSYITAQPV